MTLVDQGPLGHHVDSKKSLFLTKITGLYHDKDLASPAPIWFSFTKKPKNATEEQAFK
jgi:hypothetical protein